MKRTHLENATSICGDCYKAGKNPDDYFDARDQLRIAAKLGEIKPGLAEKLIEECEKCTGRVSLIAMNLRVYHSYGLREEDFEI